MSAKAIVATTRKTVNGGLHGLQNRFIEWKNNGAVVKVGLPKGSGTHGPSGKAVVELGAIHEFGSSDGRIPERSFLRGTMKKKRKAHNEIIRKLARSITLGKGTPENALNKLGARVSADVKETIANGVQPPNAPSTVRRKGSSKPLVDTGALRQAITWQVVSKGQR